MVAVAVAAPRSTPVGSSTGSIVTRKVSSSSTRASSVVRIERVLVVSPGAKTASVREFAE